MLPPRAVAASFATAAPLLREEALVVSLLDDPPPAYGPDSVEAFLEAFAAEYGVSLAALTRASDAYAASGKVGGSTLTTSPGKKHDGRVAEIRLRGDEERRLKRLWPSCLLLARHGSTEVPARTARGEVASSLPAELVEDLNDEDARVPAPFGATLRLSFRASATRSSAASYWRRRASSARRRNLRSMVIKGTLYEEKAREGLWRCPSPKTSSGSRRV